MDILIHEDIVTHTHTHKLITSYNIYTVTHCIMLNIIPVCIHTVFA